MKCVLISECAFFLDKLQEMPAMSEVLKERFCLEDYSGCARYIVYLKIGKERVPQNLFPNNIEKAQQVLADVDTETETG